MLPVGVAGPIDQFMATVRQVAGDHLAGAYAAGGLALDDFSARQSNVDLVVVSDPALDSEQVASLRRAESGLRRAGRAAAVWYTSWEEIAGTPRSDASLETPMTRELLMRDALTLHGPDWPVVWHDPDAFRTWCTRRLGDLVSSRKGPLLLRRAVTPVVLEAARLAQGAVTGRVMSKSGAGESVGPLVPPHFRRILTDAVGYRRGAQTSMYWGPFERKYDALVLLRHLMDAAVSQGPSRLSAD
jgi:hypothetical protein